MKLSRQKKGITIVEMLVYLGLSTILMLTLAELFAGVLEESTKTQNYSAVQTDGQYVMTRLRNHISAASQIMVPASLGDSSTELQILVDGITYRYYLANNPQGVSQLYMNDGAADYLVSSVDSSVTDVSFVRTGNANGSPVINIQFTSSSGVAGTVQHETQVYKGAGGLRNEPI